MDFNVFLDVNNSDVAFNLGIDLNLENGISPASVSFSTEIYLDADGSSNYGYSLLQPVASQGAEGVLSSFGVATLQPVFSYGSGNEYVPPDIEYGFAYAPLFASYGEILTSNPGSGDTSLAAMLSKGGEGNYGEGSAFTSPAVSIGQYGSQYYASCVEIAYALAVPVPIMEHIVFINSSGTITDTITGTREAIQEMIEELTANDTVTVIGTFIAEISGELSALTSISAAVGDLPSIDGSSRVWVVNMETFATSQYDGYGFIRFFKDNGKSYGVAEDGIYELSGDTDNGTQIDSLIDFGRSDMGTQYKKRVKNVYLGTSSEGKMYLKVDADETSYVYEARSNSPEVRNHRVDIGKGLSGNYFNFTLMNQNGCDFNLETITFEPIRLTRKIR